NGRALAFDESMTHRGPIRVGSAFLPLLCLVAGASCSDGGVDSVGSGGSVSGSGGTFDGAGGAAPGGGGHAGGGATSSGGGLSSGGALAAGGGLSSGGALAAGGASSGGAGAAGGAAGGGETSSGGMASSGGTGGVSSPGPCRAIGWATRNGRTGGAVDVTGGGDVTPVVVSTFAELQTQASGRQPAVIHVQGPVGSGWTGTSGDRLEVGSNKTIVGLEPGTELKAPIHVKNSSN